MTAAVESSALLYAECRGPAFVCALWRSRDAPCRLGPAEWQLLRRAAATSTPQTSFSRRKISRPPCGRMAGIQPSLHIRTAAVQLHNCCAAFATSALLSMLSLIYIVLNLLSQQCDLASLLIHRFLCNIVPSYTLHWPIASPHESNLGHSFSIYESAVSWLSHTTVASYQAVQHPQFPFDISDRVRYRAES